MSNVHFVFYSDIVATTVVVIRDDDARIISLPARPRKDSARNRGVTVGRRSSPGVFNRTSVARP